MNAPDEPPSDSRSPAKDPSRASSDASRLAVLGVLAAGAALRAFALVAYRPSIVTDNVHDGAGYIRAAHRGFAWGADEPSGYPLFLRAMHFVSHHLWVTIAVQHALGLAGGWLLLLAARRLGAPRLLALVPAAAVWLNLDGVFLEHAPLSEGLFTPLVCAVTYSAVRSLDGGWRWPVATGALAAVLLAVRTVATPLPLVLVAALALALHARRLPWRRVCAGALAAAAAVSFGYMAVRGSETDRFAVTADGSGWNIYMRAAQFADCTKFTPPAGTRALCDATPIARRAGPGFYRWLGGPAVRAFGSDRQDRLVRDFALTAIVQQPLDYARFVLTDVVHYIDPGFGGYHYGDFGGPLSVRFMLGIPAPDPALLHEIDTYYTPVPPARRAVSPLLHDLQGFLRVSGPMLLLALLMACAGALRAAGPLRWGVGLLLAIALELILVPTLTAATWRYAVPAVGPLLAAAAIGVAQLAGQAELPLGSSRRRRQLGTSP